MTREHVESLVAQGRARWLDENTAVVGKSPPLWRYADSTREDNYIVDPGSDVIVRFRPR